MYPYQNMSTNISLSDRFENQKNAPMASSRLNSGFDLSQADNSFFMPPMNQHPPTPYSGSYMIPNMNFKHAGGVSRCHSGEEFYNNGNGFNNNLSQRMDNPGGITTRIPNFPTMIENERRNMTEKPYGPYPTTRRRGGEASHLNSRERREGINRRAFMFGERHTTNDGYGSKLEPYNRRRPIQERLDGEDRVYRRPLNPEFHINRYGRCNDTHRKHFNNVGKAKEELDKELEEYMDEVRQKKAKEEADMSLKGKSEDAECRKKRK